MYWGYAIPVSAVAHCCYGFFFGLRAMLIFSRQPKYIKNAP